MWGDTMEFEAVEVMTRDEYKGAQEPVSFTWRGLEYPVTKVMDRWYEGSPNPARMPLLYFKVMTRSGGKFLLRYHELFRTWSILVPGS